MIFLHQNYCWNQSAPLFSVGNDGEVDKGICQFGLPNGVKYVMRWSRNVIETHLPDMLRVVLSVKAGTIRPSTILRKLGTYSRRNKLYQAFRELGDEVRTEFLLHLLGDPDLRSTLQSAMNKSEAFNGFAKWALFGGEGVIAENRRDEQRKIIKFNHLVANCVILYNVFVVSKELQKLAREGREFDEQAVAALSPYIRTRRRSNTIFLFQRKSGRSS